jgi:hypothetical protein
MIIVHDIFICKPGNASELAKMFKEAMTVPHGIAGDLSGLVISNFRKFYYNFSRSSTRTGNLLIRFPVAANSALVSAGAMGGTPGSPAPPIFSVLGTM